MPVRLHFTIAELTESWRFCCCEEYFSWWTGMVQQLLEELRLRWKNKKSQSSWHSFCFSCKNSVWIVGFNTVWKSVLFMFSVEFFILQILWPVGFLRPINPNIWRLKRMRCVGRKRQKENRICFRHGTDHWFDVRFVSIHYQNGVSRRDAVNTECKPSQEEVSVHPLSLGKFYHGIWNTVISASKTSENYHRRKSCPNGAYTPHKWMGSLAVSKLFYTRTTSLHA